MDEQKPTMDLPKKQTEEQTQGQIKKHTENQVYEPSKKQKVTAREWIKKHQIISGIIITVVGSLITGGVFALINRVDAKLKDDPTPYVTFMSDNTQVFHLSKEVETLEYSVGKKRWEKLGTQSIVFGGDRGNLLLRSQNKYGTNGANIIFDSDAQVICAGDICTLIDYKNYEQVDTKEANFSFLFLHCKQLVVAPELTPNDLAEECYFSMFRGCSSLKKAPKLPANKLTSKCYYCMFSNCTSLETAPELPAMELAEHCYGHMFSGCTSLKTHPELPATELAFACYLGMFMNCTSLQIAPRLPATELADLCYYAMFSGCTSLYKVGMVADSIDDKGEICSWLDNTSPTGIFYKNKDAQWNNDGVIPSGWTIIPIAADEYYEDW